jgi:eukaryotic translation initiation factor 2-alpha kinase 4
LRSQGVEILQTLWAHDISAELAKDARSPEDLMAKHRDDSYLWFIIIKQDSMLKIKSFGRKDTGDSDIQATQLLSWIKADLRERDYKTPWKLKVLNAPPDSVASGEGKREQDVKILVGQTRSKKFNRRTVVEQAQVKAAALMESFLDGPILAVEGSDQIMEAVRETSLSDPDSWRKVEHAVATSERKYVREIHDQLDTWRHKYEKKNGSKHSFLYNFRTGNCLYYDLGQ